MPLSRDELLGIFGAMDQGKLVQALSAVGVNVQDDQGSYKDGVYQENGDSDNQGLASWNATSVKVPSGSRPSLFDKSATVDAQPSGVQGQSMSKPRPYDQGPDMGQDIAPFAANA